MDPYQLAFHWVRRRLLDEPETPLTPHEVHRASGVAPRTCRQVLIDLARSGFLVAADGETFTRPGGRMRSSSTGASLGGH